MALKTNYMIIGVDCSDLKRRPGAIVPITTKGLTESEFVTRYNYKRKSGTPSSTKMAIWGDYMNEPLINNKVTIKSSIYSSLRFNYAAEGNIRITLVTCDDRTCKQATYTVLKGNSSCSIPSLYIGQNRYISSISPTQDSYYKYTY